MSLLEETEREYGKMGRAYLFENRCGGSFTRQYVTREIARAGRRVLKRRITAHNLRHARAMDLFQKTRRLKGISEMLGTLPPLLQRGSICVTLSLMTNFSTGRGCSERDSAT